GGGGGLFSGLLYGPALWTGTAASPTNGGEPSPGGGGSSQQRRRRQQRHQFSPHDPAPDELCVILDEQNFMVVVPDPPYSPLHGGLLLCVAPLKNTTAKIH
ncbi:unnamed protein product, partial [Ectocarpus sp. 12 AP-2014]